MHKSRNLRLGLMASVSGILLASAAQAQEAASENVPGQDIVVTAQRRSEALQDVPISITAVTSDTIKNTGMQRLEDIGRLAPAVQISRTGIFTQPAIRGVTTAQGNYSENNVAVYVDGFYLPSARGLNTELVNIESVQVLKGPQGTLFGRNATGGAILIETLKPSMTETSGRFLAGYGNYDDFRAQGYISTPLASGVALNIAGSYRRSDGYIKDVAGFNTAPIRIASVNPKLRLQPSDRLDVILSATYSSVEDGRSLATTNEGRSFAKFLNPAGYVETRDNRTSFTHPVKSKAEDYMYSLKAKYDLGGVDLNWLTAYQLEKTALDFEANDGTAAVLYDSISQEKYKTFTQEVNFSSKGDGPLQFVVGGYYYHMNQRSPYNIRTLAYPGTTYVPSNESRYITESFAGFADVTYRIGDSLFLTGGLRYSHETKDASFVNPTTKAVTGPFRVSADSVTPRAVIRYEIAPKTSIYASYSRGFKSGVVNNVAPYAPVAPEKIDAFEVGFKTAQSNFRLDAAGYYYDYSNLQVSSVLIVNGLNQSVITNAAAATIYGGEVQMSARPVEGLDLSAGIAYTHARYDKYTGAVVSLPSPTTGLNSSSCANPNPPPATVLCTQDQSGLRMLRAPDWSGNVSASYKVPLSFGSLQLSGNVSFSSFQVLTRADKALTGSGYRYGQPGYALLNLRAAYTTPDEHWTLSVFGNNVTDTRYYIVRSGTSFGDYHVLGEPATYGAQVEFRF